MSDTPETDEYTINNTALSVDSGIVILCRKLERERDEATQQRDEMIKLIDQIAWEAGMIDYDVGHKILDRRDAILGKAKGKNQ